MTMIVAIAMTMAMAMATGTFLTSRSTRVGMIAPNDVRRDILMQQPRDYLDTKKAADKTRHHYKASSTVSPAIVDKVSLRLG